MGREEKRQRDRLIKQLTSRFGREPNEDEIEKALAKLQETKRKQSDRVPRR